MIDATIRREEERDLEAVRLVNQRAFGGANEAAIVDALRGLAGAISVVARFNDQVVGHVLFTPVVVEGVELRVPAAGVAPLAVLPECQRQGIGSGLVRAGLDACRSQGYGLVVVLGHPQYYPKFGFVPASSLGLRCEFPVPPDVFMALELQAGALAHGRGLVRYWPEFGNKWSRFL